MYEYPSNSLTRFTNILDSSLDLNEQWSVSFRSLSILAPKSAKKINVHLEEVYKELTNKDSATLISSIPYEASSKNSLYFTYETERDEFFTLSYNNLTRLNISIRDENNHQLRLTSGQPTILKLKFKKFKMSHQILHLSSKNSITHFPLNESASFTNKLNTPIDLGGGGWKVALSSIIFPRELAPRFPIYSHYKKESKKLDFSIGIVTGEVGEDGKVDASTQRSKYRHFTPEEVCDEELLKKEIINSFKDLLDADCRFCEGKICLAHYTRRFSLILSEGMHFLINGDGEEYEKQTEYIKESIGGHEYMIFSYFNSNKALFPVRAHKIQQKWSYNLNRLKPSSMLMYCSIISPVFFGDKKIKLLKLIPSESLASASENNYVQYRPIHLDFVPVQNCFIPTIDIELRAISGQLVRFKNSNLETHVNLLFIRK